MNKRSSPVPDSYYLDISRYPVQKWPTTRRQFLAIRRLRLEIACLDKKWYAAFKTSDKRCMRGLARLIQLNTKTIDGLGQKIVLGNLRLAAGVANKFIRKVNALTLAGGLGPGDLISAANMGLMVALKNFDVGKGLRFSTYATYPIKTAVIDELHRQYTTLPRAAVLAIKSLIRAEADLYKEGNFHPTDDETLCALQAIDGKCWTPSQLNHLKTARDANFARVDPGSLVVFDDEPADDNILREAVNDLPHHLREVIEKRYYSGPEVHTLRELAPSFGVSCAWIQVLECRALEELRARIRAKIRKGVRPTMDDQRFTDKLRHAANSEVVRRLLIRYFVRKGFDNFDVPIYPPTLMDLQVLVPELAEHVEIVPHSRDIDPLNDSAELGWNLFVLGTHRQYLGESFHHNLHTLSLMLQQNQIIEEDKVATHQTTPRQIIHFVTRALAQNRAGYVDLTPRTNTAAMPRVGAGISKPFYTKPGGMHCG